MLFWIWKKDIIKLLKIHQLELSICWGLSGTVWKSHWSFKQQPEIKWNLCTYLFSSTVIFIFIVISP